jgi:hypothetical protein
MYSINKSNNNVISNTQFLIDLHILLLKRAQKNNLTYLCLLDNSDLQQNYFTINCLTSLDKEWSLKLNISEGRVKYLFNSRYTSLISPIEKIFKHFK